MTTASEALRVRKADLSRVRPTKWFWDRRLPFGYLGILLGDEGIGKGTLQAWMIAKASRGELPGDAYGQPIRTLLLSDEDSFDAVVVPRLHAAGADLDLVDVLDADEDVDLRRDALRLSHLLHTGGYSFLVIDQLLDAIGADTDDWRQRDVRGALRPLRRIARELEVAVLAAVHPNKGQKSSFRDLMSGAPAFNASSRSSLLLAPHPDDPDDRILVRGKGNLSAPPPSFEFTLAGVEKTINGHRFDLPVVTDPREGVLTIEDVVKRPREAPVRDSLAEKIDQLGTGEIQRRADIAKALNRRADDRSVDRALQSLEDEGRWEKVDRGKWQKVGFGIGGYRQPPMSKFAPREVAEAVA